MMMHGGNLKLKETTYLIRCKNSQPGWYGIYLHFLPEGDRAIFRMSHCWNVVFNQKMDKFQLGCHNNNNNMTKIRETQIMQETGAGDN